MSTPKFAETHNLVVFLEKPKESNRFEGIIDFLNASSIKYALTIQALVDKKKVIITKKSVRRDIMLEDAERTECLPNDVIFEQLTLIGNLEGGVKFLMYPRFVQVFLDKQVEGMSKHEGIYVTPSHTKKIFANIKREGKGFSRRITPLFRTMMVQAPEYMEPIPDEATNEEPISTPSYDPPQSGEDRLQLTELMNLFGTEKEVKNFRAQKVKEEVTFIDETQERYDEEMLFDVQDDLQGEEVIAEKEVSSGDVVTTASATTTVDELTLAQTLIEIKQLNQRLLQLLPQQLLLLLLAQDQRQKKLSFMIKRRKHMHLHK
ncbi:hypothetical protein Tco_1414049 [Tanacetum coccineum]